MAPCVAAQYVQELRLETNVACLDYSVARMPKEGREHEPKGKLVAYRWNGEQVLSNDSFVAVERVESEKGPTG